MRTQAPLRIVVVALILAPSAARADMIEAATECPPGMSRTIFLPDRTAGELFAHGGPPPCAPAACTTAAGCGDGQACRLDAHCIAQREERELRVQPDGRRGPLDRNDPASYATVVQTYDLGRCEEGRCPEGARCLQIAVCREAAARDEAPVARAPRAGLDLVAAGSRAERVWTAATPYDATRAAPDPPPARTPDEPASSVAPRASSVAPRAPASADTSCSSAARARTDPASFVVVVFALLALRARPRRCGSAHQPVGDVTKHREQRLG